MKDVVIKMMYKVFFLALFCNSLLLTNTIAQNLGDGNSCSNHESIDWMTLQSILTSNKIDHLSDNLSNKSLQIRQLDSYQNIIKKKVYEIDSEQKLNAQFNLIGDYLKENGVSIFEDSASCQEILIKIQQNSINEQDLGKLVVFKIDNLFVAYLKPEVPRMGLRTVYFFDNNFNELDRIGF